MNKYEIAHRKGVTEEDENTVPKTYGILIGACLASTYLTGSVRGGGKQKPPLLPATRMVTTFAIAILRKKRPQCYWHTRSTLSAAAPTVGDRQTGQGWGTIAAHLSQRSRVFE